MSLEKIVIIGASGGFGVLLSKLLSDASYTVSGIDLQQDAAGTGGFSLLVSSDIMNMTGEAKRLIQEAHCVILSLPEEVALACFPRVVELLSTGSLLLDILSVKSSIVTLMKEVEKPLELLSLHPMFAPQVGFQGQNVVVVEIRPGPRSAEILSFIRDCGAALTFLTAEQHDASTAAIQVATHAALIAFGLTLHSLNYEVEKAVQISTPMHRVMLALLSRILAGDAEIYWRIQLKHPLAPQARAALMQSLEALGEAVGRGDFEGFGKLLDSTSASLTPEMENLADYCARIFRLK